MVTGHLLLESELSERQLIAGIAAVAVAAVETFDFERSSLAAGPSKGSQCCCILGRRIDLHLGLKSS